jgi:hypothetical protein
MIDTEKLREAIKPGTSESLIYWILFTNHHHNSHRTPEETVAKFQGTELGKCLDFNILEKLMHKPTKTPPADPPIRSCIERESKVSVTLSHAQAAELFNLLEANKVQHPELHELVYQAMTKELFSRINTGGLQ